MAHAFGTNTKYLDQQVNGGKWNYHGTYFFEAGSSGYVELTDTANGKVIADAVYLKREGN